MGRVIRGRTVVVLSMRFTLGPLSVKIKYVFSRGNTTFYQRAVPTDLRSRYPGANIKVNLDTNDAAQVARMVDRLNKKYEAEWAALRAAPESSPEALKAHARDFLKSWGLDPDAPKNDPKAIELLSDYVDDKRVAFADGDEDAFHSARSEDFLTPTEMLAGELLYGPKVDTISDALEVYLDTNRRKGNEKFETYARRAFSTVVAVCGDKDIRAFTRSDARLYVSAALRSGNKTTTVRRRINSFRAVWSAYAVEKAHDLNNPWERLTIPGEGDDAVKRVPLSSDQLNQLWKACRDRDDDMRWVVAMLIDTGARLAEIAGLALDDIKLDDPVPHILIQPHPWRSLKTKIARKVPLHGAALWAAKRVIESAGPGQRFAFPRYTNEQECKATSASGALVKWVKGLGIEHVLHELRHTMKDRLRDVECPKWINDGICGHSSSDQGDGYGEAQFLEVKSKWLAKVALRLPEGV